VSISTREQQKALQNTRANAVSQLSRRARTQELAQNQAHVARADMKQLPFQDVARSAQVSAPHAAGFVTVRKATFHQLATPPQ
jgi:hypothetical protein